MAVPVFVAVRMLLPLPLPLSCPLDALDHSVACSAPPSAARATPAPPLIPAASALYLSVTRGRSFDSDSDSQHRHSSSPPKLLYQVAAQEWCSLSPVITHSIVMVVTRGAFH